MKAEARAGRITSGCAGAVREWAWLPDLAGGLVDLLAALPKMQPGVIHAGTPPVMSDAELAERIAPGFPHDFEMSGPLRPPMGTARPSPMTDIEWTPVNDGLAHLNLSGTAA